MGECETCLESWDLQRLFSNRSVRSCACEAERISICLLDAFQEHQPGTSKTTFPLSSPSEVPGKKLCLSMKASWMIGSVWSVTTDLKAVSQQAEKTKKRKMGTLLPQQSPTWQFSDGWGLMQSPSCPGEAGGEGRAHHANRRPWMASTFQEVCCA